MSSTNQTIKCPPSIRALICMLALLLLGCQSERPERPPEPRPSPTETITQHTLPPTTKDQAEFTGAAELTLEATATPEKKTIQLGSTEGLKIELPSGWKAMQFGRADIEERLAEVAGPSNETDKLLNAIGVETTVFSAEFVGPTEGDSIRPLMTVVIVPRHDIKLGQYIEELVAEIKSSGADVNRAGLIYDIRTDGTPVGVVAFDLPISNGQPLLAGYHLAQFDDYGENLVVMTWTADRNTIEVMQPDFDAMAAAMARVQEGTANSR